MSIRRFCIFLCGMPAWASATWILGGDGDSCDKACTRTNQVCTEHELLLRNGQVNSNGEVAELVRSLGGNCTKYNLDYGMKTDVPAYHAKTGECYVSSSRRKESSFSCDRSAPTGKQRLCWCHAAGAAGLGTKSTETSTGGRKTDQNLSFELIIGIIGGNLLFLGLVGTCFCVVCRGMMSGSPAECANGKPAEAAKTFMHCPACNCSLQKSRSTNTVSYEVTQSRAFRAGASSNSSPMEAFRMGDDDTTKSSTRSPWNHSKRTKPTVSFHMGSKSNSESLMSVAEENIENMQEKV